MSNHSWDVDVAWTRIDGIQGDGNDFKGWTIAGVVRFFIVVVVAVSSSHSLIFSLVLIFPFSLVHLARSCAPLQPFDSYSLRHFTSRPPFFRITSASRPTSSLDHPSRYLNAPRIFASLSFSRLASLPPRSSSLRSSERSIGSVQLRQPAHEIVFDRRWRRWKSGRKGLWRLDLGSSESLAGSWLGVWSTGIRGPE